MYHLHFETELFHLGNKPGRLMANMAKGRLRASSHITGLRDKEGKFHIYPKRINLILQEFY